MQENNPQWQNSTKLLNSLFFPNGLDGVFDTGDSLSLSYKKKKGYGETNNLNRNNNTFGNAIYPSKPGTTTNQVKLITANTQSSSQVSIVNNNNKNTNNINNTNGYNDNSQLIRNIPTGGRISRPEWHAPWELMRVVSGHLGWVRSICVEPDNQWFATGSADKTIKIWDLASGRLRLTLTGHIMGIRGLIVSPRHPYLFSAGEDKMVKCWDLESNKVIRHYHGHLSSVYSIDLHPTLDVLATAGKDATVRLWDIRSRDCIHVLTGHKAAVSSVKCFPADPQVISGSMDSTIRLWDIVAGKTMGVLTHHKKAVRALETNINERTFASAAADNIKQWHTDSGTFMFNFYPQHNAIINTISRNQDGVLFSGADNGTMSFYDWKTGQQFQESETIPVPGSLDPEKGIFASTFDKTGLRLITCEADKSIKVWREKPNATPESDPGILW